MRRPLGLIAAVAVSAAIATPVSTAQAATESAASVGSAQENTVVRLVNARRAKAGCRALKHHTRLHRAARAHAADMAENNYFSHTSRDGRSFTDRIEKAGFGGGAGMAANIAKGQPTPAAVVNSWMKYPGTRAGIVDCKYTFIGVGAVEDDKGDIYWVQYFATK